MNSVKHHNDKDGAPQVIEPNFFLQRKLGGPAGRMINPISIGRAEAALKMAMPSVEEEVRRLLIDLQLCVQTKSCHARGTIWSHAHEIRGLAGTASKVYLGEAANIICRYLNGTEPTFMPDEAVLSTIATVALLAVRDGADEDPMVKKLLVDSILAVNAQRAREGRSIE